jgi:hypothetical protein
MNLLEIHRLPSRIKMKTNAVNAKQIGTMYAASGTSIACHRNVKFPGPVYPAMDGPGHLPAKEQWPQSSYLKPLL